ncbi:MAG: FkbM family methyltransferase [bacterium]
MQTIIDETKTIKSEYGNYTISQSRKDLVEKFMSSTIRYLFGRNGHSKAICESIKIDYVIDDFAPEGTIFEGSKVVKAQDIPQDAIVVNCVLMAYVGVVNERLTDCGIMSVIPVADLYYLYPEKFEFPTFTLETREKFLNNIQQWQEIFDNLADSISKKTLKDILMYRLTSQDEFLSEYKVRIKEQYFEDFLNLKDGEVFVDCGGFDGDTSEEFIARCPNYEKIYFFEPSETNLLKAKERLADQTNVEFIDKGVSDKEECLCFSFNGSASKVSGEGEFTIQTTTIDKYIDKKITFIKMDLEGWELAALKGSESHIKNDCPKLAIAVYHKPQDFYEIFEYVKSIQPKYNVYLRHYTQGWSETVMFFVKKGL